MIAFDVLIAYQSKYLCIFTSPPAGLATKTRLLNMEGMGVKKKKQSTFPPPLQCIIPDKKKCLGCAIEVVNIVKVNPNGSLFLNEATQLWHLCGYRAW